ncbi:MAG: nonstructural protein [Microviridae sp.]|nr:MAG: nonstructural protein [Microviridae sp.]
MAVTLVCAVYDSAAGCYGRPWFVPAKGLAIRSFVDEIRRPAPDNPLNAHPDDFALWLIAEYDDNVGAFVNLPNPEKLITGLAASATE